MNELNINNEIKKENDRNIDFSEDEINKKQQKQIIIKKLPLNIIKEKINNNEINIDYAPPSSPKRRKIENTKRNLAYSVKLGDYYGNQKIPALSLFYEESKSDDEDNINDQKLDIIEEENEGRKSIYTKYYDKEQNINDNINIDEIFDNTVYIKKLEEKWKYEKILLDYNIIDFTSK